MYSRDPSSDGGVHVDPGLIPYQAIVALAKGPMTSSGLEPTPSTKRYNFPVKGCMLFGVPNRGSDVAHTATGILTLLNTVFNVNRNMIQDLDQKSQRLADIASQFRQVRHEHSIPVISFFEQQKYGSGLGLVRIKYSRSSLFCNQQCADISTFLFLAKSYAYD